MRVLKKFEIGTERWTAYLVSKKNKRMTDPEGDVCEGRIFYDERKIFINQDIPESARAHTLFHEIIHAVLWVSGANKVYNCDDKKDELIVSAITPILHRLVTDFGFSFLHSG